MIPNIQPKFTRHSEKLKNMTHNNEKNQSIKIDTELEHMLELADKNIKTVILIVFHIFKS